MVRLYRLAGSPSVADETEPFGDVVARQDHYDAIVWAHRTGVTTGSPDGTFRLVDPIDRNARRSCTATPARSPMSRRRPHRPRTSSR